MLKAKLIVALTALASTAYWISVAPGVVFEIEVTFHGTSKVEQQAIKIEGPLVRMPVITSLTAQGEHVFDGRKGELSFIDHAKRKYVPGHFLGKNQQIGRNHLRFRRVGAEQQMGTYPVIHYELQREGRTVLELWVTDWSNLKGGNEAKLAVAGMKRHFEQKESGRWMRDLFLFEKGFPVAGNFMNPQGKTLKSWRLQHVKRGYIDLKEFERPRGYK